MSYPFFFLAPSIELLAHSRSYQLFDVEGQEVLRVIVFGICRDALLLPWKNLIASITCNSFWAHSENLMTSWMNDL